VPAGGVLQVDVDAARTAWRAVKRDLGEEGERIPQALERAGEPVLVVPLEKDGRVTTIQLITAGGDKLLLPGGEKRGACLLLGRPGRTLYVAEGLATALTVREATGEACAVAIDRTNLAPVAQRLREKYPSARIVIAADNDQFTDGNPGLRNAEEAAELAGGSVACPAFSDLSAKPTDFNDLAALDGLEAVREQLGARKALGFVRASDWAGEAPVDREWLVQDWMPMRQTTALYAKGGTGKTLAVQQLLTAVSSGTQ
jgi:putative DNA primase/helicase